MVSALNSQQLSALSNLLDINATMSDLQTRITTGKKINSVFDGATQYLQSESMNSRSSALLAVNKQVDLTVSAVSMAQKGLAKIKSDFTNTIADLRALKGTTAASGPVVGVPTDEVIKGVTASVTGETSSVSASAPTMGIQASAVRAAKKVFGAAAAPASATGEGSLGVALPTGTNVLRVEVIRANATNTGIMANGVLGVDFTGADAGDGSNNLANLTVGDVVRKLNASAALDTGVGGNFQATIDPDGTLRFSSSTAVAMKMRIGLVPGGSATVANSSQISTDLNTSFALGAYNGNTTVGWSASVAGVSSGLTLAEAEGTDAKVAPPSLFAQVMSPTRRLYDGDAIPANNAVQWDQASNAVSYGNYGLATGNAIAVAVTENGAKSYVTITAAELNAVPANATAADFVTQFNSKAAAAGLGTRAVFDATKGLTFTGGGAGTSVSLGQGATALAASASADAGALNQAFGFTGVAQLAVVDATAAVDASAVSLIGSGAGLFQAGDTFSVTVRSDDPARPDTRTMSFKATASSPSSFTGFDGSSTRPYEFTTMEDLKKAINTAFSPGQVRADAVKLPGTGTGTVASQFQFQLTLDDSMTLEIAQTNNVGDGTASANGMLGGLPLLRNGANALDRLFGSATGTAAGQLASSLAGDQLINTQDNKNGSGTTVSRQENYGAKIVYTRKASTAAVSGDAKREATSQSIARMLSLVASTVEDASLVGQPNLLKGATLSTALSDGDATFDIGLGAGVDTTSLGFAMAGNSYAILSGSLGDDAAVDRAITAFQDALSRLDGHQSTLASSSSVLSTSKSFNEGLSKVLTEAASSITSSNATEDAAQMQALSTRYQLATSALGILNQSTQLAGQLLR